MDIFSLLEKATPLHSQAIQGTKFDSSQPSNITLPLDIRSLAHNRSQTEHCLAWLDHQIVFLRTYRSYLRIRYNQRQPAYALPFEILSQLFRILSAQCGTSGKPNYSFSRVCKRWREVALNDPGIWAYAISLTDSTPSMAIEMLVRAKGHPVGIYVDLENITPEREHILKLAMSKDIHGLDVTTINSDLSPLISALSYTTTLKELRVYSRSVSRAPISAHPNLITAPYLRELNLSYCIFPLSTTQSLQHLTKLYIHSDISYLPRLSAVSLPNILALLQGTPQLKEIMLFSSIRLEHSVLDPPLPTSIITLPKLQSLSIWDRLHHIVELLGYLEPPDLRVLKIGCGYWSELESNSQSSNEILLGQLVRIIPRTPLASSPCHLKVSQGYPRDTDQRIFFTLYQPSDSDLSSSLLELDLYFLSDELPRLFTQFFSKCIPAENIRKAYMYQWFRGMQALVLLPALSEIQMSYMTADFLNALRASSNIGKTSRSLSVITFNLAEWEGTLSDDAASPNSLTQLMVRQIELGMPLQKIVFCKCVPKEGVEGLVSVLEGYKVSIEVNDHICAV